MTKKIVFIALFLLCFSFLSSAEPPKPIKKETQDPRERMKAMEEQSLKDLKERNPQAYQERMRMKALSQKLSQILSSFREGKMNEVQARRELTPLARESVEARLRNLDREIEQARKKLEYLEKLKKDPNLLVSGQVDRYLGKRSPEEDLLYR